MVDLKRSVRTKKTAPSRQIRTRASTYRAHRERQRRRILGAASRLFNERGIDRVTMAEITGASGVQPSTMYQYFSSKDDIVWEIVGDLMRERSDVAANAMKDAPNALARITALLGMMADDLSNHAETVRFMAQFDAIYARDWPVERLVSLESQIHPEPFRLFSELIREGISDGSLRSDLDPDLTMHAVVNAVVGAQRRLASLGSKVETEYGKPIDQLLRESIRILLLGMRGGEAATESKTETSKTRKRSS
jgi:AcrR family transcriptional regulator